MNPSRPSVVFGRWLHPRRRRSTLRTLARAFSGNRREVHAVGRAAGEALRARGEESLAGRRVEMETAQPRELAGAALGQLRSELDEARVLHESAAGKLQRGRWEDAVGDLRAALGHWQRVQAGVGQCLKLLGAGLLRSGDGPDLDLAPALDELAVRLRGLMESVRQRDTVAMADALVYEWPAAIDRWHELLEAMSQRIDDPHA